MTPDFHPLFQTDIDSIEEHIFTVTEDLRAAYRRLHEIDGMIDKILANPMSGNRLGGELKSCLVRHGGRDNKITLVFQPKLEEHSVYFILAAFGGQNWSEAVKDRL